MERIILPILLCLAAGAAIGGAIYFARNGISARAKRILLGLVAEAECYFGEGTGSIKFSAVLGRLYSQMPAVMQLLFKPETIEGWIEEAVAALKRYLSEANV